VKTKSLRKSTLHHVPSVPDLALHSPSDIVGTPFDVTSSVPFEYPFPKNNEHSPDSSYPLSASMTSLTSPLSVSVPLPLLSNSVKLSLHLPQKRNFSAKHPKLRSYSMDETPVPPGLAKRMLRHIGMPHRIDSDTSFGSDVSVESGTSGESMVDASHNA
jgi:hypothetical protein